MEVVRRVLLADTGEELRRSLASGLSSETDMQVVGQTGDGVELLRMIRELKPDIVVMELVLTGMDVPSVGVSTPEAFARYDMMGSPVHPDCEAQEQAIRDCNLAGVCAAGGNALEHCSGAVETPAICKTLREHGAVMAQMTGSGAAVFGIFDDENAARSAVAALKNGYKQVYLCKPTHGGPRVTVRRLFGAKK